MTKGQLDFAERKALENFDKWNDVSGVYQVGTSYYEEVRSIIEDAVHIGAQMATIGKINYNKDKKIKRE